MISGLCVNKSLNDPKLSVMNFLNEIVKKYPKAISFAPGRPIEKYFNVECSLNYIRQFLAFSGYGRPNPTSFDDIGQYSDTKGFISDFISRLVLNDEGVVSDPNNIIVTTGCQEAMCLCLLTLAANTADVVLVEEPSYVGIVGASKIFGIEVVGVPTDGNGIVVEKLKPIVEKLRRMNKIPRLIYVSPDFSNPSGFTSSAERRIKLLEETRSLGLMILEDHAYNYFNYSETKIACLKSLPNSEHVIYLGSFSKSVYPGVRTGFLIADQSLIKSNGLQVKLSEELSKVKSFLTVNTSSISQAIVAGLLIDQDFSLISHTEKRRLTLKSNRDLMVESLKRYFPKNEPWSSGVEWSNPLGGFFITVKLPFCISDSMLYQCAENYEVIWTPMSYFYIGEVQSSSIRLSFSYVSDTQVIEGVARLSKFVRKQMELIKS